MMSRLILAISIAVAAFTSLSCSHSDDRLASEATDMLRLDRAMVALDTTVTLDSTMTAGARGWLMASRGISPSSLTDNEIDSLLRVERSSRAFTLFEADVERLLPSLAEAMTAAGRIDSFPREIYGIVSPYNQSVVIVDTTVLVALNHYLGPDYEGYASFPEYMRRRQTIERMPIDIAEAWQRARYPFPDSITSPTLLQRMAYEGAILASVADMLGISEGALLLGWSDSQWTDAVANEDEAWRRIVGREMLFSDDASLVGRMIADGPATPDVSPDSPGSLGRFIGLRIVRASQQNPAEMLRERSYLDPSLAGVYSRSHR